LTNTSQPNTPSTEPQPDAGDCKVGYGKPPRHAQFRKGISGCPTGRPKRAPGISIKEILDGDQRGKNGEVISRREAVVIALVNEALQYNQRAFSKFIKLMRDAGLMRHEKSANPTVVNVPMRSTTMEEFMRDFGRPHNKSAK
jgi:hypothetical protein